MKLLIAILCLSITTWGQTKNLVLEGGGIRGIAYVGALKKLEETSKMSSIENVGGTSVGALIGSLVATGYRAHELEEILQNLNFKKLSNGKGFFVGGTKRVLKQYGWYRTDNLEAFLNEHYQAKTGISNITLGQLDSLSTIGQSKGFRCTATDLSNQRSLTITSQKYPNMTLARAVRISCGIPIYFSAVFMDTEGNTFFEQSEKEDRIILVDGGFVENYPIHLFDDLEGQTIGLRMERNEQIELDNSNNRILAPYKINSFHSYITALYNFTIENLNRGTLSEQDWERTISISQCGIGPKIKKMPEEDIQKLIHSGYSATESYFNSPSK